MKTPDDKPKCACCQDTGWVCEHHNAHAWPCCDGSGVACRMCNDSVNPRNPPGFEPLPLDEDLH